MGSIADQLSRHTRGDQQIVAKYNEGGFFDNPLEATNGLLAMNLSYPTDQELENLPCVWLTVDDLWGPVVLLDKNGVQIFPCWTPSENGGEELNACNHANIADVNRFACNLSP